jgi:nucleotide-binding universal stress UspA family protein
VARVLIATNGCDAALRATRHAAELLGCHHDFTVLAVAPEATTPFLDGSTTAEINETYEHELEPALDNTVAALGVPARRRMEHGNPAFRIVEVADRERADLIVLGARRRRRLRDLLHWSVSGYVIDHASCPVLVLPANARRDTDAVWPWP